MKLKKEKVPQLMKWHATFREKCIRTGNHEPSYDEKWGQCKAAERLNVESPLPFVVHDKKTNMFHLVKALHIIYAFLKQDQDCRNVNAPYK